MSTPIKLWDHQRKAVENARGKPGYALFFEMGTGKTATCIHILRELYQSHGRLLRTFILCPPIVIRNWKKEFGIHSKIKPQDIVCLDGKGVKREEMIRKEGFFNNHKLGKIFITNYESLRMESVFHRLKIWDPEVLICDEAHKLKDIKAKRTKRAVELSDNIHFKYLLTGTPILNTPMDLFSQYRILDGGRSFGKNFFAFRNTYFYDKNSGMPQQRYFPNWQIKPKAMEEIKKKIEPTAMSVKKSECLDLPELVRKTLSISLGGEQKKAYEDMKKHFITFIEDKACTAELAITKALRLQQILSGFLPVGEEPYREIMRFKENPRADAIRELLEEITPYHKVLVWAVFREDFVILSEICEELELPFVEVHGEISQKRKTDSVEAFNTDPKVRVFIGHPGSGGIGINLTSASYSIFYSRNFSLEQDLQAEARNYRGGSEIHEKITRIDLVAEGTLDELILEKLQKKQAMGESIIREMAKELKDGSIHIPNDGD